MKPAPPVTNIVLLLIPAASVHGIEARPSRLAYHQENVSQHAVQPESFQRGVMRPRRRSPWTRALLWRLGAM